MQEKCQFCRKHPIIEKDGKVNCAIGANPCKHKPQATPTPPVPPAQQATPTPPLPRWARVLLLITLALFFIVSGVYNILLYGQTQTKDSVIQAQSTTQAHSISTIKTQDTTIQAQSATMQAAQTALAQQPHQIWLTVTAYAGTQQALASGTTKATFLGQSIDPSTVTTGITVNVYFILQNTGDMTWSPQHYSLTCVPDPDICTKPNSVLPDRAVLPNDTYTFHTSFTAPLNSGPYTPNWQLQMNGAAVRLYHNNDNSCDNTHSCNNLYITVNVQ